MTFLAQSDRAECGLACLGMVASHHGAELDLFDLRERFAISANGTNLLRLMEHARALGFVARPMRAEIGSLPKIALPAILHWDLNHFVVLSKAGRRAEIFDPAKGIILLEWGEFSRHYTGIALELTPSPDFAPMRSAGRVSLKVLAGRIHGLSGSLLQLIGLALIVEATALVIPLQLQLQFDHALPNGDTNLIVLIAAAMTAVLALQTVTSLARSWTISWFGSTLNAQWVINLFAHLLKLPTDYFQRRHVGDIVSRFYSIRQIQTKLTAGFVEAVLDGFMSLGALCIMIFYSTALSGIVVVALTLYLVIRQSFYRTLWRTNEEQVLFGAQQQTEFMDSIRGIQAIKLANKQAQRHARLANITLAGARLDMRAQKISLSLSVLSRTIFGLQRIAVIGLGAQMIVSGRFTAGMLVAFVTYSEQFTQRSADMIDKVIEVLLLRTHTNRIADIALAPPEEDSGNIVPCPDALKPAIELRNIGFRYGQDDLWVLKNLDVKIDAGEAVAIVGPSGCGKSTLARIILGLLRPTEGQVLLDGVDVRAIGFARFRTIAAAVMQDDTLFSGSIAENISFFAQDADYREDDIIASARLAGVHDQIMAMPMGYETLVGDMGTTLSGGQKQRIILARAIFRRPKILLLDEATSHLDVTSEQAVNAAIAEMKITRIIIAHRPQTIASASRIIDLGSLNTGGSSNFASVTALAVPHQQPQLA